MGNICSYTSFHYLQYQTEPIDNDKSCVNLERHSEYTHLKETRTDSL